VKAEKFVQFGYLKLLFKRTKLLNKKNAKKIFRKARYEVKFAKIYKIISKMQSTR